MCLKFPEITCRIGKITLKRPKNRQKIPLFFTTKYLQTIIYINNINIKLTYHMHKYVVIKMKKIASFKHQLPLKDLCILRLLMHDISVFAIKSHWLYFRSTLKFNSETCNIFTFWSQHIYAYEMSIWYWWYLYKLWFLGTLYSKIGVFLSVFRSI